MISNTCRPEFNQDTNNFSPRAGIAWSPVRKFVLRAGFGIFFDRYILANLSRAIEKDGVKLSNRSPMDPRQPSVHVRRWRRAHRSLSQLRVHPSSVPIPHMATPYSEQASAGTEYSLASNFSLRRRLSLRPRCVISRVRSMRICSPPIRANCFECRQLSALPISLRSSSGSSFFSPLASIRNSTTYTRCKIAPARPTTASPSPSAAR